MRAIVVDEFGPPEALRVAAAAAPVPGPGEVVVEICAAPVNYVDLLVVGGTYQFLPPFPFIPGKSPAGVVTALGSDVTTLRVGDRVLATAEEGGYAEMVAVAADQCHPLPPRMSFAEAASAAIVYDTSWVALRGRARASAARSGRDTPASTRAPIARASCTAAWPTPPEAPSTSTLWPGTSRARPERAGA